MCSFQDKEMALLAVVGTQVPDEPGDAHDKAYSVTDFQSCHMSSWTKYHAEVCP
jgi:hypothetical protein